MDILLTEITEMSPGTYCVGAWDVANSRMVRPLPGGHNWTAAAVNQLGLVPGMTIRVTPQGQSNGALPHLTEDMPIDAASITVQPGTFNDWQNQGAPTIDPNLAAAFGGALQWNKVWNGTKQGVHVPPGTQCRSLVAVRVNRNNIYFDEPFNKLRGNIFDGQDNYQLTVSSRALKEAWKAGGLPAVNKLVPKQNMICVRVGLARAYQPSPTTPRGCYAMLNGVL